MSQPASSRRILVIDDQPEIHADFQKILAPAAARASDGLSRLRAAVKGASAGPATPASGPSYTIESAHQGEDGFKKIATAHDAGQPYSVAYVDMRMPPGWDGLRTMKEIWDRDPEIQLVVCTAFSDHPWSDIDAFADRSDRVLVLKKPFDPVEVKRMTSTLSAKWRLAREASAKRTELEDLLEQRQELFDAERQKDARHLQELESTIRQLTSQTRDLASLADSAAHAPSREPAPDAAAGRYSLDGSKSWEGGGIV